RGSSRTRSSRNRISDILIRTGRRERRPQDWSPAPRGLPKIRKLSGIGQSCLPHKMDWPEALGPARGVQNLAQALSDDEILARLQRHGYDLYLVAAFGGFRILITFADRQHEAGVAGGQYFNAGGARAQFLVAVRNAESPGVFIPAHHQGRIAVACFGNPDLGFDARNRIDKLLNAHGPR